MKRTLKNQFLVPISCAIFFVATSFHHYTSEKDNLVAKITYIGHSLERPVFQLDLENNETVEFMISIRDGQHNLLYTEKLKGNRITRRYKLDADEEQIVGTTFEVSRRNTNETIVYRVNSNVKIVRDLVVSRL